MVDAKFDFAKPVSGGGFGDCKVAIVKFDGGKYVVGGFNIGIKEEPLFMFSTDGFRLKFDAGKVQFWKPVGGDANISYSECGIDDDITGSIMLVMKGTY